MNKINSLLFLSLVLIVFGSNSYSQNRPSKIYFKDGSILEGYGKIIKDKVKFRVSKKSESQEIEFTKIDSVLLKYKKKMHAYALIKVAESDKPMILEILVHGPTSLYVKTTRIDDNGFEQSPPFIPKKNRILAIGPDLNDEFYIKKNVDLEASYYWMGNPLTESFKKVSMDYFKDCPSLVNKIKAKEFRQSDFIEIVLYYNNNCLL